MNFKTYLNNIIKAKEERAAELRKLIKEATTADEVRSLGDTLNAVLEELQAAKDQLAAAEGEEDPGEEHEAQRSANPMHEFRNRTQYNTQQRSNDEDPTNSVEYRTAFMNFVCRGTAIPAEARAEVTATTDVQAVIPTTILHEIVKEMGAYGEVYERVRHLNVQGGVQIPILSLKPTANWIGEKAPSESQKIEANDSVTFSYYGLECKVAQTLLVNVTTLEVFQREFATLAAEAMVRALEVAIFTGDGNGKPLGILNDDRVEKVVTLTADEFESWADWKKKVFGQMKKAYRNGTFFMAQGTFDGYIDGMVDSNGQPIGRVNYGTADGETYRFGGKEVLTVEDDIIADYETAEAGAVVAVFGNLKNYGLNSNMTMQVVKWTDHDTNEVKNKAILICDGKIIDPHGFILIKKG